MELTLSDAEQKLTERLSAVPEIRAYVENPTFTKNISEILEAEGIDNKFLSTVYQELLFVLTLCTPISSLGLNLSESIEVPKINAERLAKILQTTLLVPYLNELIDVSVLIKPAPPVAKTVYEPPPVMRAGYAGGGNEVGNRPLTREEVLQALTASPLPASPQTPPANSQSSQTR